MGLQAIRIVNEVIDDHLNRLNHHVDRQEIDKLRKDMIDRIENECVEIPEKEETLISPTCKNNFPPGRQLPFGHGSVH